MEFMKLLLSGNLILIFVMAFSADGNPDTVSRIVKDGRGVNFRLPDYVIPKNYSIELTLDIEKNIFHGVSNVNIIINKSTQNISLHLANLKLIQSTLHTVELSLYTIVYTAHNISYIDDMQIVILHFEHEMFPGKYLLNMKFMGIIANNEGGFFRSSYQVKNKTSVIATHASAIAMRRLFPCWDEPGFKANFTMTMKYHKDYVIYSSLAKIVTLITEEDLKMTIFETSPAISTYLLGMVMYELSSLIQFDKLASRQQAEQHLRYAWNVISNVTHCFDFRRPQFEKPYVEFHCVTPGVPDDGTHKWKLISYREADVIYDEEIDPIGRKIEVSRLIGRKTAGEWFGTMISPSWWSYMWLNEGIAMFFGTYMVNKTFPDSRMMDLFVVQIHQESLHLDDQGIINPLTLEVNNISDLNSLFSFAYYVKAPAICRMLQHVLSSEVSWSDMLTFFKRQSTTPNDFWAAMQSIYETQILGSTRFNITDMIDVWTKGKHYPILDIEVRQNQSILVKNLYSPEFYVTLKADWIPVTYTTETSMNFNDTLPHFWLRPDEDKVYRHLEENEWVIFNLQQTGYYRVHYYTSNWLRLSCYLNSKNYTKIHVLNRAQIIDDAFHFMQWGIKPPSIFWKVTHYLSQETDYIAWYPMIKALERMSFCIPFSKNDDFKILVLNRLNPLLLKIGYTDNPNEHYLVKCLRQEATKWACILGDIKCKQEAAARLKWHLYFPKTKLLPSWKKWTYCNGLWAANKVTIPNVILTYLSKKKKDINQLESLSCCNKFSNIIPYFKPLKKLRHDYEPNFNKEKRDTFIKHLISMFHFIVMRHANNCSTLNYILDNWEEIKLKEISTTAALIDIINHVYSSEQLDKIMEFVQNTMVKSLSISAKYLDSEVLLNKKQVELSKNSIKLLISDFQDKVDRRLSEIKRHITSCAYVYSTTFDVHI